MSEGRGLQASRVNPEWGWGWRHWPDALDVGKGEEGRKGRRGGRGGGGRITGGSRGVKTLSIWHGILSDGVHFSFRLDSRHHSETPKRKT